ncbi:GAF and ANTAR domain-containing protein [Nocardioides sp. S-58]|uniref:GAF and ANTAR domain-containing protein n=1 Tax=Nocardioides renjunii TaxID=3095075 RepID=A0ABU5K629_9ACTN|nr:MULTISPECIES: GAF and ANTAR domain-containing protein [unclassified Nocardioides]MDZ5660408.1 GAF and ANTAR domain-containing protein [Nocardioides sp. S-58]
MIGEFSELTRALSNAPDETARLQLAIESAVTLVTRCDHAGITLNDKHGQIITRVSTDGVVRRANELQHELGEGPCIELDRDQDTFVSPDLSQERRWTQWAPRAYEELGVESMISVLIFKDKRSYGALSLYAKQGQRFDVDDVAVAHALAGHLAVVMTAEREIDHLGIALLSRITIGRAEGILMERLDITADQAFDYLRRASSHANRKLIDVAEEIARTRKLLDLD